ncbi:MAG TPA: YuiB family protein [Bacilli bacterium]
MLQMIVATALIFVLAYGLAFILDMLVKTTWLPIYAYLIFIVLYVYFNWDSGSFGEYLQEYTYVDVLPAIGGLAGAALSCWSIHYLRKKGYKMF